MQRVHIVTLGCARNDVDSDELAARLSAGGFELTDDAAAADAVVVNTCGFVDAAKKDSIDTVLSHAELKGGVRGPKAVVAVGCLAERYGQELANELPEADAVLGFDSYQDIAARLQRILQGEKLPSHVPQDRRKLLPISPVDRAATDVTPIPRVRLEQGPFASLKIASGCDRRCTFCAIPQFRGAYQSRRPHDILDEARWLVTEGVKEVFLVSENSTSYGKDLGDLRLLEALIPELAAIDGLERVRVSYLQPAELRPGLIEVLAGTDKVAPYFDLSFQHANAAVLRRMRRFGGVDEFLGLLERIRERAPLAGTRSNFIVGFPGETEQEFDDLVDFITRARLDYVGVFGYSNEDGTEALGFDGQLPQDEIDERVATITELVDELCNQRAEDRVGEQVRVLVEQVARDGVEGRAAHQGPEVDGVTRINTRASVGEFVDAVVVGSDGVDLVAEVR
jgi:ribosomal protein S12 methylthiotransferase RimO